MRHICLLITLWNTTQLHMLVVGDGGEDATVKSKGEHTVVLWG